MPAPSTTELIGELEGLKETELTGSGAWSPFKVFSHLAQSVECSMSGYPVMKPALFRSTVGALVFFVFRTAGAMRHGLAEPVPGAPEIAESGPSKAAIERLIAALKSFDAHRGEFKPHFAYGNLSKADYAAAHVMHVRNHLTEIRAAD